MNLPVRREVIPVAALALSLSFVLPFGQAAQAQSRNVSAASKVTGVATSRAHVSIPKKNAKQLFLHSSHRQTNVHLMPTTAWLHKNAKLVDANGSVQTWSKAASPSGSLPAPACTLATDNSVGDAKAAPPGVGVEGPFDSLDMSAVGLGTVKDTSGGTDLEAQFKVVSLTDGSGGDPAMATGQPDNWFAQWSDASGGSTTTYYLRAQYSGGDPATGTVYTYGQLTMAGPETLHTPLGTATGSMDTANNIITIMTPLSNVGSPATNDKLTNVSFDTDVQVGSPLYVADSQQSPVNYPVGATGTTCPVPSTPGTPPAGPVPSKGNQNNLTHYGGPIVHSVHNYLIFWLPQAGTTSSPDGSTCPEPATTTYNYEPTGVGSGSDSNYEAILGQYFSDLQGSSYYNLLAQYADQTSGAVQNSEALGGTWTDPCGYTSTPSPGETVPGGTTPNPMYDVDIQNEVQRAMAINHWKPGLGNEYFVFTGYQAASCFAPPSPGAPTPECNLASVVPTYCAYHGDYINSSGTPVLYANMSDGAFASAPGTSTGLCYEAPIGTTDPTHKVNGTSVTDYVADAEVSITSHEEFETVSDAMVGTAAQYAPPLGWYSSRNDQADGEIGDKCAYMYGTYDPNDGANITLQNGDRYIVQQEWSNWANGCALGGADGATPYGGASDAVTIESGWNLLAVPAGGLTSTTSLIADMERTGQLPDGSVKELATYGNGRWTVTIPGYTRNQGLQRTQGIFTLSSVGGKTWTPSTSPYTSAATLHMNPGWNLVAPTWPNPGLMTDSMFNQIEAEQNACAVGSAFLNPNCNPTVNAIDAYASGKYLTWSPSPKDSQGNPIWPQELGNRVPFTNGMWVRASKAINWTPQGTKCQTIVNGMCQ